MYSIGIPEDTAPADMSASGTSSANVTSPALSDNNMEFSVPAVMPASDKELFDVMFEQ